MPRLYNLGKAEKEKQRRRLAKRSKKAPVIDIGGVWKKVYKNPRAKNRGYPDDIQCCKCGNLILDYTWFYSKVVGSSGSQKTVYYCAICFEELWI